MDLNKRKLEELISQEYTIGSYGFNEQKNYFFCDTAISLYITRISENSFVPVYYFFDGYEVYNSDSEKEIYEGDETTAKQKAIDSFNKVKFMGYAIIFTNITCNLHEEG